MKEITELALRKALYQQARREGTGNINILIRMAIFFPAFFAVLIVPIFVPPIDYVRQFHNWMWERPVDLQPVFFGVMFTLAVLALMCLVMHRFDKAVEAHIDRVYDGLLAEHGISRNGK